MQARTHVHLMLLALFFSSSVPSIAEPLINGLFSKKKRKNSVEYPVCYRQKSPAREPCNFSKKKKKTENPVVCALCHHTMVHSMLTDRPAGLQIAWGK